MQKSQIKIDFAEIKFDMIEDPRESEFSFRKYVLL